MKPLTKADRPKTREEFLRELISTHKFRIAVQGKQIAKGYIVQVINPEVAIVDILEKRRQRPHDSLYSVHRDGMGRVYRDRLRFRSSTRTTLKAGVTTPFAGEEEPSSTVPMEKTVCSALRRRLPWPLNKLQRSFKPSRFTGAPFTVIKFNLQTLQI
jgi:hypothetical protein